MCVTLRASRSRPSALTACQSFLICGVGSLGPELSPVTAGLPSGGPKRLRAPVAGAAHDSGKQRPEPRHQRPCPSQLALCKDLERLPENQDLSTFSTQRAGLDLELRPIENQNLHVFHGFKPDTFSESVVRTSAGLSRPKQRVWDQNLGLLRSVQLLGAFH